jgi:hypothetical protein
MKTQKILKKECKPQANYLCCICGENIKSKFAGLSIGNNAYPFGHPNDSRCCDVCNWNIVIPTRIGISFVIVNQ